MDLEESQILLVPMMPATWARAVLRRERRLAFDDVDVADVVGCPSEGFLEG